MDLYFVNEIRSKKIFSQICLIPKVGMRIVLSLIQNRVGVKSMLGETVLGEEPL